MKDNEDRYIVKKKPLSKPSTKYQRPIMQQLNEDGKTIFNAHGEKKKEIGKDVTKDEKLVESDLKEIDLSNLFEKGSIDSLIFYSGNQKKPFVLSDGEESSQ